MQNLAVRIDARNATVSTIHSLPTRVRAVVVEEAALASVTPERLLSAHADRHTAHARFMAWYRIRQMIAADGKPFSLPRIGAWFGKDHTSVRHGIIRAEQIIAERAA